MSEFLFSCFMLAHCDCHGLLGHNNRTAIVNIISNTCAFSHYDRSKSLLLKRPVQKSAHFHLTFLSA